MIILLVLAALVGGLGGFALAYSFGLLAALAAGMLGGSLLAAVVAAGLAFHNRRRALRSAPKVLRSKPEPDSNGIRADAPSP